MRFSLGIKNPSFLDVFLALYQKDKDGHGR